MVDNPRLRWDECMTSIRQSVSQDQYETWFSGLKFERYNSAENTVRVSVPSRYIYEYLEANFVSLLNHTLFQFFGQGTRLEYFLANPIPGSRGGVMESDPPAELPAQGQTQRTRNLPPIDSQLNPRQSFDNFIEGESNKMPRSIGFSVAEHPKKHNFNPFFVYGPSGCGKTHLINAIGVKIRQMYPTMRVLYVPARIFQVQFTEATRSNTINDFIAFYQTIDVLIVDDIQEWVTAQKTQNTFFHIFNHLFMNGKRIILASDRAPVDLQGMEDRLLTRFKMGLIAELEKPNEQLCIDILQAKIRRDGLNIAPDVVEYIAKTANGSVRDLEGVINSLLAYSVVYNTAVDMRLVERVVKRAVKVDNHPLTVDEIVAAVCKQCNVEEQQVMSRSRKKDIAQARHLCNYFAQKYTKLSGSRIGKLMGGLDHSTVIHSRTVVEQRLVTDKEFKSFVAEIEQSFKLKH